MRLMDEAMLGLFDTSLWLLICYIYNRPLNHSLNEEENVCNAKLNYTMILFYVICSIVSDR